MAPEAPREQEQSIKARKRELFAEEQGAGPLRRFEEYLKDTPPSPLSVGQWAALVGVGILVLLVLFTALLTIPSPHGRHRAPSPPTGAAAGGR
jgi:hypothetical protein